VCAALEDGATMIAREGRWEPVQGVERFGADGRLVALESAA
jgi:hypothetical protein